mgnify:CR=1 FL=1
MTKERIARQNINWRIIDGGIEESSVKEEVLLGELIQFGRTPNSLEVEQAIVSEKETTIEFVGPKRLPREIEVKIGQQLKEEIKWNIRNFFKRK